MSLIIPSEYTHWGIKKPEKIRLFRGDIVWLENTGMYSGLLQKGYSIDINAILWWTPHYRSRLIDKHLWSSTDSPFISTTLNPQMAQVFATRKWTTIYELEVPWGMVILDDRNMGKCEESWEILVIWRIDPNWIKRVKINNDDDTESELYDPKRGIIHLFPYIPSNRVVRNNGNWRLSNNN
jgi:hypothetical protein